jgi:protein TonB
MGFRYHGWSDYWQRQGTWTWAVLGSLLVHGLLLALILAVFKEGPSPPPLVVPVETIALVPMPPGTHGGGGGQRAPVDKPVPVAPKPVSPRLRPRPKPRTRPKRLAKVKPAPPRRPEPAEAPPISRPAPSPAITRTQSLITANHPAGAPNAPIRAAGTIGGGATTGRGTGSGGQVGPGQGRGSGYGSALSAYLGKVRRLLAKHKNYPWMARQRNIQGVVVVRFTIAAGGRIDAARISHSSGHDLLDEAARETLRQVGHFPPLPAALNCQKLTIEVPLAFRLSNE